MIRAVIDANLVISYLLLAGVGRPPTEILRAALARAFVLLLPEEAVAEVRDKVTTKPYLRSRIAREDAELLLRRLAGVAVQLPTLAGPIPVVSRDRADDYLVAHAIAARADYLVSGDKDLLTLGGVDGVRVVAPAEFLALLGATGTP